MANNDENLIAAVGLDLDSWQRGIDKMIADERKVDRALDGVVDAANDAEKALNDIDGSIDLDVDTGDLEKAKNIASDLDALDPNVDVNVDESELDTVRRLLDDINSEDPNVNVVVDETELDAAERIVNDIDSATPTVDVDVDKEEVDEAHELLTQIRDMQVIQIVMDVSGTAVSFITDTLTNIPGIGSIIEMDNAMARFEGTTGRTMASFEGLVDELHGEGVLQGAEAIGEVASQAVQLGIHMQDVDDAALATFNTITVTGGDAQETLTTIDTLVDQGLAASFQEASDIIVTGFQSGANRGQDFLDVLNEYGSTFSRMGFDGESALNLINSGLDAGFGNADRVADALREMDIRVHELDFTAIDAAMEAFENGDISVDELNGVLGETGVALNELDLLDETRAFLNGELSGEDYFNSVITALNNVEDASDQAQEAVAIFGTQAEDIGVDAITSLTTEGLEGIEGRAQEAADAVTNTISGSIAEVQILIDDLARAFFSSDQIDIDGKIDDIKARIQTFIDEINSGATFGEALEIALNMPGLEDQFHDLEAIVGNLAMAIVSAFATILDALGQGGAADQLRASIEDMASGQLVFDVQVADNAEAISTAVQAAVDRGLDPAEIQTSLETAFSEAMAAGDFDTAQMIVDNINAANEAIGDLDAGQLMQMGEVPVTLTLDTAGYQAQIDQAMTTTRAQIDAALASGDVAGATALASQIGSSLQAEFDRLIASGDFDLAARIAASTGDATMMETTVSAAEAAGMSDEDIAEMQANAQAAVEAAETASIETIAAAEETSSTLEDAATSAAAFNTETTESFDAAGLSASGYADVVESNMQRANVALDTATENVNEFESAYNALSALEDINLTVTTTTTDANGSSVGHAGGGIFSGDSWVGEEGPELISTDTRVAVLNNETTESILSGLAALLGGGWTGGGESSITIHQNNTFNNTGAAASTASLDNASRAIRGY